jgi:hypothetical protein
MAEGEFALGSEHLEQALRKASLAAKWGSMASDLDVNASLADLAVQQRDAAKLREFAPVVEEMARGLGHRLYQAVAYRALGVAHRLAHQYPQAETRLVQALHSFETLEARWQIGRTLVELAELARAQSDTAQARIYLADALRAFTAQGASMAVERARSALESLG